MAEEIRPVPPRLAALLAAFSQKLTGEQMQECVKESERIYSPTLNYAADRICRWVLEDEAVASWYGFERSQGLEQIRSMRWKLETLLKTVTDVGNYSIFGELAYVGRSVKGFEDKYLKMIADIKAELGVE